MIIIDNNNNKQKSKAMPKPAGWDAIHNFTTIFGTALNGSEITWFNDSSADAAAAERT